MGCIPTKQRGSMSDEDLMKLFLARVHNAGVTNKQLIAITDPKKRKEEVEKYFFAPEDADIVVEQWKGIKPEQESGPPPLEDNLSLPQEVSVEERRTRKDECEKRCLEYKWVPATDDPSVQLPVNPDSKLPECEFRGADHAVDLFGYAITTKLSLTFNAAADFIHDKFVDEEDVFKNWRDLYSSCGLPAVAKDDRWKTDKEFAQQRLNGVNPTLIRRLENIPDATSTGFPKRFPVTEDHAKGIIPSNKTLADLVKDGRVFWCDYEWMDGIRAPKENNSCAPFAAFFFDDSQTLMPLAIQLSQTPGDNAPIFTPKNCSPNCWLFVKMHVQTADAFQHEVTAHYLATHQIMEMVYVAMKRNVSDRHPIAHLLLPHFWFTMALNWSARRDLIAAGGAVPRLMVGGYEGLVDVMQKGWTTWNFSRYDLPTRLKKRGMFTQAECPKNYYRDDALQIWGIIEQYAKDMVFYFYKDDAAVKADGEIQAWLQEMSSVLGIKGIPADGEGKWSQREQLVLFVTELIFTVTAGHSAVNNGQWDYFGYIPNVPGKLKLPPPTRTDAQYSFAQIAAALPGNTDSIDQIVVVRALASPADKVIGEYPENYFKETPGVQPFIKGFQKALNDMSGDVQKRNAGLEAAGEVPYPYMDPKQVHGSVAN